MKRATDSETLTFIDFGHLKQFCVLSGKKQKSDASVLENFGLVLEAVIDL